MNKHDADSGAASMYIQTFGDTPPQLVAKYAHIITSVIGDHSY